MLEDGKNNYKYRVISEILRKCANLCYYFYVDKIIVFIEK